MNTINLSAHTTRNLYQKILLDALAPMKRGRLQMQLPGGDFVYFGDTDECVASIKIESDAFFRRCVFFGDIGFAESYLDGEWHSEDLVSLFRWFILNIDESGVLSGSRKPNPFLNLFRIVNKLFHRLNKNTRSGSRKNIAEHYDLSNQFFSLFLDPSLTYSSAYFAGKTMSLEDAQIAKYRRLCEQLKIVPGDHVLEIGSGWGANAVYMASEFGCRVTTVTVSEQQHAHASELVKTQGLESSVQVLLRDYRDITGLYDKIVSIEMLEAVGAENYDRYFQTCDRLLKKDGLLGLQVITSPSSRFESFKKNVDFIQKHIFPGSLLPSLSAICNSLAKVSELELVDLKEFGTDYAKTLKCWRSEFEKNLPAVAALGFDEYFQRKWRYYLSYCEAAFANKNIYLMQMVFSRPNNPVRP